MRQADAVRRIDVKGLGLGRTTAASGWVTDMADTHVAGELPHMTGAENVPDEAVVLAEIEFALVAGHDAGSILATMLEHRQTVVQGKIDVGFTNYADDATHARTPCFLLQFLQRLTMNAS